MSEESARYLERAEHALAALKLEEGREFVAHIRAMLATKPA